MRFHAVRSAAVVAGLLAGAFAIPSAAAGTPPDQAADPAAHWTAQRQAAAQPRDLVIDRRGLAYLRAADGRLTPHGHAVAAEERAGRPVPDARPTGPGGGGTGGGTTDTTGPAVSDLDPSNVTIGANHQFAATVADPSGIRSVSFEIRSAGGTTYSFAASSLGGDRWGVGLQFSASGDWSWRVIATDAVRKGGNTTTSPSAPFTVQISPPDGGGGGTGDVITNAAWTEPGPVKSATGRIYFEMPTNPKRTRWAGYVCSGTTVTDGTTGRSVVLTAAHCVYDDAYKAFARNVLFIPDQAHSGTGTDRDCSNDLHGCWTPSFGVVDDDWTTRTFPANVAWDYGYYVIGDSAHSGAGTGGVLDVAVGSLAVDWNSPTVGARTHALGYSYSEDPGFMYCAEGLGVLDAVNWWLPSCGLSGGASGGPWIQPLENGSGPIVSVNSWGYTNQPGMAGPKLSGSSARCVFDTAISRSLSTSGGAAPAC